MQLLVQLGDALYAFEARGIAIVRNGAVIAQAPASVAVWGAATTIPALDGEGRWVVATDQDGHVFRVRATGELESIADQLRIAHATTIVSAGSTLAITTPDGLAVSSDAMHLSRYPVQGAVAVGKQRLAVGDAQGVDLWDLPHGTRTRFAVPQARPAFLDAEGTPRLVVATPTALYVEDRGKLEKLGAPPEPQVIIAGTKLWVASGSALYAFDGAGLVRTATEVPRAARLFGDRDGNLWIADGERLVGHALAQRSDDPRWRAEILPVFQRVCAHCHLPGGSADVDLSTAAAWSAARTEIDRRVVVTRTMPPAGTELSDGERAAIAAWLR